MKHEKPILGGFVNTFFIAGHLGADPEVRFTQSGKKVTTLRVATNSREGQADVTMWVRVTIWEEQFAKMIPYLKKGSAVMVWGELHKPKIFTDKEGKPQTSLEMTATDLKFSPFGKSAGAQSEGQPAAAPAASAPAAPFGAFPGASSPYASHGTPTGKGETFDDEVPF